MIKFVYRENGQEVEANVDKYSDLIRLVISKNVQDEDFVSLQLAEDMAPIEGIGGLKDTLMNVATAVDALNEAFAGEEEDEE